VGAAVYHSNIEKWLNEKLDNFAKQYETNQDATSPHPKTNDNEDKLFNKKPAKAEAGAGTQSGSGPGDGPGVCGTGSATMAAVSKMLMIF